MQLGDVSLHPVADGMSYLPSDHFGVVEGAAHAAALGDDGQLHIPIGGFVMHTAGLTVLLDAGLGPRSVDWEPAPGRRARLEAAADMDRALGIKVRDRIMRELEAGDLVSGPHFPELRWGRMLTGEGRLSWAVGSDG